MRTDETKEPIGYVFHAKNAAQAALRRRKEKYEKITIPVYGINYFDNSRYHRGTMKPNMRAVPAVPSDSDYAALAAAVNKRARRARKGNQINDR